jgi:hypothetical protein
MCSAAAESIAVSANEAASIRRTTGRYYERMSLQSARRTLFLTGVAVLLAAGVAGCASTGGPSPTGDQAVNVGHLDAYKLADLLPTNREVTSRLGWTHNVNYTAPDFGNIEKLNAKRLIDAAGGSRVIGIGCADAIKKYGVIPGGPLGAEAVSSNMWADESISSTRELWLARYPSTKAATAQIKGLPAVIAACPSTGLVSGGRTVAVVPSKLVGAVAYEASDSYSWVVASYGDLVAQVEVGKSAAELASGEDLIRLQLAKLESISRGTYK